MFDLNIKIFHNFLMKKMLFYIKEFFFFFFCYFLLLFPYEWSWEKNKKKPIVFVHGYLNNSNIFVFLGNYLNKKGFGPIYTINFKHSFKEISNHVTELEKKISHLNNPILIGHSMGGLVSLSYALSKKNISKVICLGVPFEGTKIAVLGFGKSAKQMRYRSTFTKNLKEKILKAKIPIYYIASTSDQIVFPRSSAVLKEKKGKIFPNLGHSSLVFSKKVAEQIVSWIK